MKNEYWKDEVAPVMKAKFDTAELKADLKYFVEGSLSGLHQTFCPIDEKKLYGTYVLNIVILSYPYGWNPSTEELEWPPEGHDEAIKRYKEAYSQFPYVKTHFYMDTTWMEGFVGSTLVAGFALFLEKIQEMCDDLAEYGVTYMGGVEHGDPTLFDELIKKHFSGEPK